MFHFILKNVLFINLSYVRGQRHEAGNRMCPQEQKVTRLLLYGEILANAEAGVNIATTTVYGRRYGHKRRATS
jgi:hypothetical protein